MNLGAVLALVALICLGLIALAAIRARQASSAVVAITRRPLQRLAPINADKIRLIDELRARQFAQLEAELVGYQRRAEQDPQAEADAHQAFEAFFRNDADLAAPLQEWIAKVPRSFAARVARAEYLEGLGSTMRSAAWQSRSASAFGRSRELYGLAGIEADAALALDPRISENYRLLIIQKRVIGPHAGCNRTAQSGLQQVPASFTIQIDLLVCLQPRWGGSYAQMDRAALAAQSMVRENPRLKILLGFADADRAQTMFNQGNYLAAINYYTRALDEGGDYAMFYRGRGEAFLSYNHYFYNRLTDGVEDLRRADLLLPQYDDTLDWLEFGQVSLADFRSALRTPEELRRLDNGLSLEHERDRNLALTAVCRSLRANLEKGN